MEHFGTNEKPFSLEEKEEIKKFMKSNPLVHVKLVEMVVSAESYYKIKYK
jgi:hypothetical protein